METIRIVNVEHYLFDECWEIYETSFPKIERRSKDYHIETMKDVAFHFDAKIMNNTVIGIIAWWNFDGIRFVEHFATHLNYRNRGFGAELLSAFSENSDSMIILEVEPPVSELSCRRIAFYERLGFVLRPIADYTHPPYWSDCSCAPLLIMSFPKLISEEMLRNFKSYFGKIHFRALQ